MVARRVVGAADDAQPESVFFQMKGRVIHEPVSLFVRPEGMKTSPVEQKAKRSAGYLVSQEISHNKPAFNTGVRCLIFCLLYGDFREIRARHPEAVPGKPDGIIPGPAADFQCPATRNRPFCHHVDEIEIRPARIPGDVCGLVSFMPAILYRHQNISASEEPKGGSAIPFSVIMPDIFRFGVTSNAGFFTATPSGAIRFP